MAKNYQLKDGFKVFEIVSPNFENDDTVYWVAVKGDQSQVEKFIQDSAFLKGFTVSNEGVAPVKYWSCDTKPDFVIGISEGEEKMAEYITDDEGELEDFANYVDEGNDPSEHICYVAMESLGLIYDEESKEFV